MQICKTCAATLAVLVVVCTGTAHAQLYEDVGTRARGMGGAFVAVADDATVTWWNPAGLATGALLSVIIEKDRATWPEDPAPLAPARRASSNGVAMAFPSLALSYYHLRATELGDSNTTGLGVADRQDVLGVSGRVRSLSVNQFGMTVGQSVGDHFVIGSTLKLMRGGLASAATPASDALNAGDDLPVSQNTRADLDLGGMAAFRHVRVGLTVRNVTEPEFGKGEDQMTLRRAARAGLAILATPDNAFAVLTVSADADLTETKTAVGTVRHAAVGGEAWLLGRRLGVRGGFTTNTIGERRTTRSAGVSVSPFKGFFVEGARTFGSDGSIEGWSTTVRLSY